MNAEVDRFPHAVVVDSQRLRTVHAAYNEKFKEVGDELEGFNKAWWQCTVLVGEMQAVWNDVSETSQKQLAEEVSGQWDKVQGAFHCIDDDNEGEDDNKVDVAMGKTSIEAILDANVRFAVDYAKRWGPNGENGLQYVHKSLEDKRFKDLDWLSYAALPSQAPNKQASSAKTAVEGMAKPANDQALNELSDEQFMKSFLQGGITPSHTTARMQLTRLWQDGSPDVNTDKTQVWLRFLSILHDGSGTMPAWFKHLNDGGRLNAKKLAFFMRTESVPQDKRWTTAKTEKVVTLIDECEKAKPVPPAKVANVEQTKGKKTKKPKTGKSLRLAVMTASKSDKNLHKNLKRPRDEKDSPVPDDDAMPVLDAETLGTISKLGVIADNLGENNILSKLEVAASEVSTTLTSVKEIAANTNAVQNTLSAVLKAAEENATVQAENTALKTKIEVAKAAIQILAGALKNKEGGTAAMDAARLTLHINGMGFPTEELNEFFPNPTAGGLTAVD